MGGIIRWLAILGALSVLTVTFIILIVKQAGIKEKKGYEPPHNYRHKQPMERMTAVVKRARSESTYSQLQVKNILRKILIKQVANANTLTFDQVERSISQGDVSTLVRDQYLAAFLMETEEELVNWTTKSIKKKSLDQKSFDEMIDEVIKRSEEIL